MSNVYYYAAKFVCGEAKATTSGAGPILAPGVYYTAINVHNPMHEPINFKKQVAVALPSEKAGSVSGWIDAHLNQGEALEIDSQDIRNHIASPSERQAPFLKGFVIIKSFVPLDVVAVYTAGVKNGSVASIHTERVPPRQMSEP